MTQPIRFALIGAAGRMGREIAKLAASQADLQLAAAIEQTGSLSLGADLGELCGLGANGLKLTDDLPSALRGVDVAIELSAPQATAAASATAAQLGVAYVCGTTGLGEQERQALAAASHRVPVLTASNLSPGIAVLRSVLDQAIRALGPGYDVEVLEMHHRGKVDAPSGTAWDLATVAANAKGTTLEPRHGRVGRTGPRTLDEIGVHAIRGGGVFGDHTVVLAGMEERLELTHRAGSRVLFAQGALLAAQYLVGKPAGHYSMADVLGLS